MITTFESANLREALVPGTMVNDAACLQSEVTHMHPQAYLQTDSALSIAKS